MTASSPSPQRLRAFVTGATGYIGSAVVRELVAAGHEVCGLTSRAANLARVEALGARAVVGDTLEPESFREIAAGYDVLIHTAQSDVRGQRVAADLGAIEALLWAAAAGDEGPAGAASPRAFLYTSGCFVLGETGDSPAHEDAPTDHPPEHVAWRPAHERRVLEAAGPRLVTAVIRPGMVYGGGRGMFGVLFASAHEEGAARVVGDGSNRWSPVYRGDVARLYRMVAERRAGGIFHCAEPEPATVAGLAQAAAEAAGADGRTRNVPLAEARAGLGAFADAVAMDQVMGCRRSRDVLGWTHDHPPFLESAAAVHEEWLEARRV